MGIRPEDIYDSRFDSMAEIPEKIEAVCDVVEPMGNEYIVYLNTKNSNITAIFDTKDMPALDEKIMISLDMNKAHFFDKESEKTIT